MSNTHVGTVPSSIKITNTNFYNDMTKLFGRLLNRNAEEIKIRRAINELRALNDRELNDLGLARSGIEAAVRFGNNYSGK